jgi:hypothetical protein
MASGTVIAPVEEPMVSAIVDRRGKYRCECGHVLRVFGGARNKREPWGIACPDSKAFRVRGQRQLPCRF